MPDPYGSIPIEQESHDTKTGPRRRPKRDLPFRKRYFFIPLSILLLFAGYYCLSLFFVPYLIEKKIPDFFQEKTGLHLKVGTTHFNPFSCSIALKDILVNAEEDDGSQTSFLSINSVFIDLDFTSLLRNGIVSDKLQIEGVSLTILRRTDKSYNFSQFFSKYSDNNTEVLDLAELPFLYSLNNISITDGTIIFNDLFSQKKHRVENLTISLPTFSNFSFDADKYIQPKFSAIINGSPIDLVSDTTSPSTQDDGSLRTLSCNLQAIDIPLYSHYLPVPFPVKIVQGKADGKLQISFISQKDKSHHLIFKYQFQAKDVLLESHDNAVSLASPQLNVEGSLKPLTGNIDLKNLILRDPVLTIKKKILGKTIDSLFLADYDSNTIGLQVPLPLPSVQIDLLIADNGKIIINTGSSSSSFESVQMSMRNYRNSSAMSTKKPAEKGTFHISGEATNKLSTFSWQGVFQDHVPTGELEINNFSLSDLLKLIAADNNTTALGSVDIRGKLATGRPGDKSSTIAVSFTEGSLAVSPIALSESDVKWFQGASAQLAPVSYSKGKFDFGKILLKNSQLHFQKGKLPSLLKNFINKDNYQASGIDFNGTISLTSEDKTSSPLHLTNVHLQLASPDDKETEADTLAFSALSATGGKIEAKGILSYKQLSSSLELAFSDLLAKTVLPWFSSSKFSVDNRTTITGSGTLLLPQKKFEGSLQIHNGIIKDPIRKAEYRFNNGVFNSLSFDSDFNNFAAKKMLFENVDILSPGLELETKKLTISSINWQRDDIHFGDVIFSDSELSTALEIPALLKPVIDEEKGTFSLNKLLMGGTVNLLKKDNKRASLLDQCSLLIENLSSKTSKKDNLAMKIKIGEQGVIESKGHLFIKPVKARLKTQFTKVKTELLSPFIKSYGQFDVYATINGNITHHFPEKMSSGSLSLIDGKLLSKDGSELLRWQKGDLQNFTHTKTPYHLGIGKLDLNGALLHLSQNDTDLFNRFSKTMQTLFIEEESTSPPSSISISKVDIPLITIADGKVEYIDERMSPVWQTVGSSIEGQLENFHLSDSTDEVNFKFNGELNSSQFTIEGAMFLSPTTATADYWLNLRKFPLKLLNEQITDAFAISTDEATVDLNFWRNDTNPVKNNIAKFSFSSIKAHQEAIETDLLLALLTDNNDTFVRDIDLLNNGKSLISQAITHFQRLLVKSGFSPFLVLPPPFDTLKDNTKIIFEPGTTSLSQAAEKILSNYIDLLQTHPRLQLILQAVVSKSSDTLALKKTLEKLEKQRVIKENEKLLQQWHQQRTNETVVDIDQESIVVEDLSSEELMAFSPVSPQPVIVTEAMLVELGKSRLKIIAERFGTNTITAQNFLILDEITISEDVTDESSGIQISLTIPSVNPQLTYQ